MRSGLFRNSPNNEDTLRIRTNAVVTVMLSLVSLGGGVARGEAQSSAAKQPAPSSAPTELQKSVEAYLRHLYAIGPNVQLTVSVPKDSEVPGLLETMVDVKDGDNSQSAK